MRTRSNLYLFPLLAFLLLLVSCGGGVSSSGDNGSKNSGSDTTAPSVPAGLSGRSFSSTQITLTWSASTDNVGVVGYRIFRDGSQVGTSTHTSYTDTGLAPSTKYSYRIYAYDTAGNISDPCATVIVEVLAVASHDVYYVSPTGDDAADGSFQHPFKHVKRAVSQMKGGDTIILRQGRYQEGHIRLTPSKNGTSDAWSTIMSYPGEWAILDGQNGGGDGGIDHLTVGFNQNSYCVLGITGGDTAGNVALRYWRFERLEITGGASADGKSAAGFNGDVGPFSFRYCYIHDNSATVSPASNNPGGLRGLVWKDSIVEYSWFKNNGCTGPEATHNCAHINIFSDYAWRTIAKDGLDDSLNHQMRNIYRYNLFDEGTYVGLKYKNKQFFTGRNEAGGHGLTDAYKTYGDNVHHNFFRKETQAILAGQDFQQVHNNIVAETNKGIATDEDVSLYKTIFYNNTVSYAPSSGIFWLHNSYDPATPFENDYYGYGYNNILDGCTSSDTWDKEELTAWRPASFTTATFNHFILSNNYSYEPASHSNDPDGDLITFIGNGSDGPVPRYTVARYKSAFPGREIWANTYSAADPLFKGTTGAARYQSRGAHALGAGKSIATGGIGGSHPYLDGVTLPNYIGATNPDDDAWVEGVLNLNQLNVSGIPINLRDASAGDPAWIEAP